MQSQLLLDTGWPQRPATGLCAQQPDRVRIHRFSRPAGRSEAVFWQAFDPSQIGRLLKAADRFDALGKIKGAHMGHLGPSGLKVLWALTKFIDYRTGRLEPSYEAIMAKTLLSRPTVRKALARLRDHGFVQWLRRWAPADEGDGTQKVKQATNAYRLLLPPAAARLLGRQDGPAPQPDDEQHRRAKVKADEKAMIEAMPLDEQAAPAGVEGPLAEQLDRLGRAIIADGVCDEREESALIPASDSNYPAEMNAGLRPNLHTHRAASPPATHKQPEQPSKASPQGPKPADKKKRCEAAGEGGLPEAPPTVFQGFMHALKQRVLAERKGAGLWGAWFQGVTPRLRGQSLEILVPNILAGAALRRHWRDAMLEIARDLGLAVDQVQILDPGDPAR